jgi:hypothetical protein
LSQNEKFFNMSGFRQGSAKYMKMVARVIYFQTANSPQDPQLQSFVVEQGWAQGLGWLARRVCSGREVGSSGVRHGKDHAGTAGGNADVDVGHLSSL